MSNVNIKRLVENIRSGTNSYTPLVELVVNGIQAVEQKQEGKGLVEIEVLRNGQADLTDRTEDVGGFIVKDNGIGFTKRNRDAFDTLYTDLKAQEGGKGFGRFTCLKYFERLNVVSTYEKDVLFYALHCMTNDERERLLHRPEIAQDRLDIVRTCLNRLFSHPMWDDPDSEVDSLLVSPRKQEELFNRKGLTEKYVISGEN